MQAEWSTTKPKLFVGSSSECLDVARVIHEELDGDAEVSVWDQGIFELTKGALESLLSEIRRTDFCVFVFAPNDVAIIRNAESGVVRDNVVFELGLAIGVLGPERSFIIKPTNTANFHLPSDLLGLNAATYNPKRDDGRLRAAVAPACNRIRAAVRKTGSRRRPIRPLTGRIGFSGAMSVGKTTLVGAVQKGLGAHHGVEQVVIYQDVGRSIIKSGGSSDRGTEFADYSAYFGRHLRNLNGPANGLMLYVRTLLDTIAYAEVNGNFTGEWMNMSREMAKLCMGLFDIYFYVPVEPGVPVVDDGVRSTDVAYRLEIDRAIHRVLREFFPACIEVNGSVEDRTRLVLSEIRRYASRRTF